MIIITNNLIAFEIMYLISRLFSYIAKVPFRGTWLILWKPPIYCTAVPQQLSAWGIIRIHSSSSTALAAFWVKLLTFTPADSLPPQPRCSVALFHPVHESCRFSPELTEEGLRQEQVQAAAMLTHTCTAVLGGDELARLAVKRARIVCRRGGKNLDDAGFVLVCLDWRTSRCFQN